MSEPREIINPIKTWWEGDKRVEPFMSKIKKALKDCGIKEPKNTHIYNKCYESVYDAIKKYDRKD